MGHRTEYKATFVKQTEQARLLRSETGKESWIPKSITTYYRNDGSGEKDNVTFSCEGWKNRELDKEGFNLA